MGEDRDSASAPVVGSTAELIIGTTGRHRQWPSGLVLATVHRAVGSPRGGARCLLQRRLRDDDGETGAAHPILRELVSRRRAAGFGILSPGRLVRELLPGLRPCVRGPGDAGAGGVVEPLRVVGRDKAGASRGPRRGFDLRRVAIEDCRDGRRSGGRRRVGQGGVAFGFGAHHCGRDARRVLEPFGQQRPQLGEVVQRRGPGALGRGRRIWGQPQRC
mmetsp:Transcript_31780/g.91547  ORF Transcript_31780/g.91547 Transcript_31780/m.91547 type:complete len:217 (+) Transcript_31780:314-964(+)